MQQQKLPPEQLERVWAKLSVAYGRFFLGQWDGIPIEAVLEDWADELGAYTGKPWAIEHALQHRPERTPLTAAMFRRLCGQATGPVAPPVPGPPPDPRRAEAVLARMERPAARDSRQWARDLMQQELRGGQLGNYQRSAWRNALGFPGDASVAHVAAALKTVAT